MPPAKSLDRATPRMLRTTALTAAGFGILVGFVYSTGTFLNHIFRRMPCASVPLYQSAVGLAPLAYLAAGIFLLLGVGMRNNATKVVGIGLGASVTGLVILATLVNVWAQAACQTRSLEEAMTECGASRNVYILRSVKTWTTVTLVAPGTTDRAFSCLSMWASTHPEYSIEVDKSVYDFARKSRN